ncbi:hypothetical protein NDU88_011364 [Pleurodeles waltl]|uniref:Uncharacterized protein n=1 Tax=Pleurodeles waltl TaxID=8319 RepID=A0AAV7QZT0_PLEWA|nr:hypothetical protein NDU88_011364 [Pleurodeles waltl]
MASEGYGQLGMVSQKNSKKEGSLKDLFTKPPAKRMAQSGAPETECGNVAGQCRWRVFMEQLIRSLREDFATLKRETAADIKDLKREVIDLGQRVEAVEQTHDAREEELDATGENSPPCKTRTKVVIPNRGSREQVTLL